QPLDAHMAGVELAKSPVVGNESRPLDVAVIHRTLPERSPGMLGLARHRSKKNSCVDIGRLARAPPRPSRHRNPCRCCDETRNLADAADVGKRERGEGKSSQLALLSIVTLCNSTACRCPRKPPQAPLAAGLALRPRRQRGATASPPRSPARARSGG